MKNILKKVNLLVNDNILAMWYFQWVDFLIIYLSEAEIYFKKES